MKLTGTFSSGVAWHRLLLALSTLCFAEWCHAITYDVLPVGFSGGYSVAGTIETDGTIGSLSLSNFVDVDISVSGPLPNSFDLSHLAVDGVSATATELTTSSFFFLMDDAGVGAPCDPGVPCEIWLVWDNFSPVVEYRVRDLLDGTILAHELVPPSAQPIPVAIAIPEPQAAVAFWIGLVGALLAARRAP